MSAICDSCGSDQDVRRAFVTTANGVILDVCTGCSVQRPEKPESLVEALDRVWAASVARRRESGRG